MNTRNWNIRAKITALLLVPLLALVALWGFATSLTIPPALDLLDFRTTSENVGQPAEVLMTELQRERRLSLVYLGGSGSVPSLAVQRDRTDAAAAAFRRSAGDADTLEAASELGRRRIGELLDQLSLLPSGRTFIDRRELDRTGALGLYTGIIDAAFRMYQPLTDVSDPELARDSRTLTALARARELRAQEDALVSGAAAAGRFTADEAAQVIQLIGTQRYLYADAIAELPGADRTRFQRLTEDRAFVRLRDMENALVSGARAGQPVPVDARQWQAAYDSVVAQTRDFEVAQAKAVAERADPVAVGIFVRLGLAGVVGLVAVLVAVLLSIRMGRSFVVRLTGLRRAALDMAENRLPDVVARLRRGEKIDVAEEVPPLRYGADEIGQVARAFNEVQLTAVRSAVDEAELRKGLSQVFLNIARRSQTLLHRQLALLDKMERRSTEPDELEDLFRVDHLATRMRRHAEDLVILAGAAPGRGWRNPVSIVDVIRGAVSEVEDYARVTVLAVEDAALLGRAVGDVTHLLAELIENATSFSPPHTKVQITGQSVPNGYVLEIEDRGLGMTPEAIDDANARLAEPPDFDPSNSARLGLFVVAQLAARHGVAVRLRPSPYGGVTAVVLLPKELTVAGAPALPQRPTAAPPGVDRVRPALVPAPERAAEPPVADAGGATPIPLNRRMRSVPRLGSRPALAPAEPSPTTSPTTSPTASPAAPPAAPPTRPDTPPVAPSAPKIVPEIVITGSPVAPPAEAPQTAQAAQTAPRQTPARPAASPASPPLSEDGLPRRIRQASLAPQLRDPTAPPPAPAASPERSPEEIRARMSALQSGTRRGRAEGGRPGGGQDAPSTAPPADDGPPVVPYQLAGPAGAPIALDVPFTGALGPIGTKEEWFTPSRVEPTDPEEDA